MRLGVACNLNPLAGWKRSIGVARCLSIELAAWVRSMLLAAKRVDCMIDVPYMMVRLESGSSVCGRA